MDRQDFCQSCEQKHDCQDVYRQLGEAESPSVALKVVVAFLVPIVVFVASLAAFQQILASVINTEELQTVVSFLLALLLTGVCVLIIRAISRSVTKNR